jgi:hypothetical protein
MHGQQTIKYCWFLLEPNHIFKNPLQTGDISEEFPLMHSESFLQPKTGCKIIFIMFILTKVKINH